MKFKFRMSILCCGLLFALGVMPARAADFYVNPAGDDANPGSKERPLKTFAAAQHAARAQAGKQAVNVLFQDGDYYLPETIGFTPADSGTAKAPVTYAAAPGAKPVLSGGLKLELKWEPYKGGVMQARVPAGLAIDQLFVNGELQHMARYPNFDPRQPMMNGYAADAFSPQRAARWADPAGGTMHVMHPALWGDVHFRITGKKADGSLDYEGGWQNNRGSAMHKQYRYVENIFEELDAPGEWFCNAKTNTLFYYPPAGIDLPGARVEVVRLRHLIEFRGDKAHPVRFINLSGFTFRHTARTFMDNKEPLLRSDWTVYRGGAVVYTGAEDCTLGDCTFDQLGGNTVFVNNYNRRITVRGCLIQNSGANGIAFVGDPAAVRSPLFNYNAKMDYAALDRTPGPKTDNYPADCLVTDCLITRTGRVEKQTAPVQIAMATGITVSHCSIYDVPRAGINIGDGCWGGNVVEYCDVFDTVMETGDHGSFNSWGRDRFWNRSRPAIQKEVAADPKLPFLDIIKPNILRNNRWRCDHGWDVDLDDGSSNYLITNNLLLNGGLKLREGYRRTATNNVLINNSLNPHVWLENSADIFTGNIVMTAYKPAGALQPKMGREIDSNFFACAEAARLKFAANGCDAHSLSGDPLFVDPAKGDFRVKEGSPALKLGFRNFPMDQFGVIKPELKAIARTPVIPPVQITTGEQQVEGPLFTWMGATVKNLSGQDFSAVGVAATQTGVFVVDVPEGSAAARAGFKSGDLIMKSGAADAVSVEAFGAQLAKAPAGEALELALWREQRPKALNLKPPFEIPKKK